MHMPIGTICWKYVVKKKKKGAYNNTAALPPIYVTDWRKSQGEKLLRNDIYVEGGVLGVVAAVVTPNSL